MSFKSVHLRSVADVACGSPGPVDVSALSALPVVGREEALGLLRGRLSNLRAQHLELGVGVCRRRGRRVVVGGLWRLASVAVGAPGKVDIATATVQYALQTKYLFTLHFWSSPA